MTLLQGPLPDSQAKQAIDHISKLAISNLAVDHRGHSNEYSLGPNPTTRSFSLSPPRIGAKGLLCPSLALPKPTPTPKTAAMHRAAQSPPLHHPVPQHVSTVPQLRSPPPPPGSAQSHQMGYGGNPYQQQQGGNMGNAFGAYGQFMNDPTAQVAAQFGQTAFKHGQEYVEQNLGRYVNVSALKYYFNVSNFYVINKLFIVLFPWRHKPWSRKQVAGANGQDLHYLPPRDDINSPDMYIPVMALVTYILLSTLVAGIRGKFNPELFGYTATTALGVVIFEIIALKVGCYLLSISSQSQLLDLIAYSGYKFVGIIATIAIAEVVNGGKGTGGWVGWLVFIYTFLANSLFLMRSLKYVLLPETSSNSGGPMQTDTRAKRNQRTQFLFFYSYLVQLFFMWLLTRS